MTNHITQNNPTNLFSETNLQMVIAAYGAPQVLQPITAPIALPNAGEVLIQVAASGVNFADTLRRQNNYFQPTPLPYVLGSEVVGHIVAVGEAVVEPYTIGTQVLAILPFGGGYANYVTAMANYCVPLPNGIKPAVATAIFVQGCTAQLMRSQLAGELSEKTVLTNAAAGGVGSLLVQLAKQNGARVIAAVGSDEKATIAMANGADAAVNYSHPNWQTNVLQLTEGKGVDTAFEMVGGEVYNQTIRLLQPGGHLIVYGCASGVQGQVHPEYFVNNSITQSGFNLAFYITQKTPVWLAALHTVTELVLSGALNVQTPHSYALKEAALAHQQIENRTTTGKVVLIP